MTAEGTPLAIYIYILKLPQPIALYIAQQAIHFSIRTYSV